MATRTSTGPTQAKAQLVRLLDRRVFDPILRAKRRGNDREILEDVQDKTRTEKERFHAYPSAGVVRRMFRDDVERSAKRGPARRVNQHLTQLGLPKLPDVADEFYRRADRLGVTEERERSTAHRPHRPHARKGAAAARARHTAR